MKLSTIIVSYNEKEFLSDAIESCLNQKGDFKHEIIIGDDGSDDGSIDIIKKYKKKYPDIIKYFVMDRKNVKNVIPSIRVSNIIKKAIALAEGEYFNLLSGDDLYIDENIFEKQINFLDNNSKYVSCYTNFKKVWPSGEEQLCRIKTDINEKIFWALMYVHISCFIFRKRVIKNMLDNFCDDTGLLYSILISGKTKRIDTVSFAYRQRDKSIMHKSDELELYLLEMLLYDDVLKKNALKNSSLSRFSKYYECLFNNRKELKNEKYEKYINFANNNSNSLIIKIMNFDKLDKYSQNKIKKDIKKGKILKKYYLLNYKLIRLFNSLI